MQQNTFRELPWRFSRMSFLSWSSKFTSYIPVIVLLLGKNSNIITPFASQNTVAITLPADGCGLNFFGLRDQSPIHWRPWALFSGSLSRTQVSSTVTRRKRKSSFDLKRFNKALHTDALVVICSSLRDFGTQRAVNWRIPKRSCKIVKKLPCEMPNGCDISSTWIRLSEYTRSRTGLHISSSVASSGRPDLASSSKDVLPRLNSPTQNLT